MFATAHAAKDKQHFVTWSQHIEFVYNEFKSQGHQSNHWQLVVSAGNERKACAADPVSLTTVCVPTWLISHKGNIVRGKYTYLRYFYSVNYDANF